MQLYLAKTRQNPKTVSFPQAKEINGLPDLLEAAHHDHIFSQMRDNYRNTDNFMQTDCLVMDLDNTHSDDPDDWKSINDIAETFPDVHFYYVQSRNYMKVKTKGGKQQEPREKYHLYFPLSKPLHTRKAAKSALDAAGAVADHVQKTTGLLDQSAAKPEQLMYGVEDPKGGEITGELCLDDYLRQPEIKAVWKNADTNSARDPKSTPADNGLQPVGLDWIEQAEQRRSVDWLENWAQEHGVELGKRYGIRAGNHADAVVYPVKCPWEADHTEYGGAMESVIIVDRGGKLNYLCRHSHCTGHTWTSYRQRVQAIADFSPQGDTGKQRETYLQTAAGCAAAGFFKSPECAMAPIETGWPTLDRFLGGGLFPGLYTMGAVPSLGKTSFILQLADSLSDRGYDVLFFSFEMTKTELMAKSISRITAQLEAGSLGRSVGGLLVSQATNTGRLEHAKSARDLMNMERRRYFTAEDWSLVNNAVKVYDEQARHLWIIEGDKDGQPLTGKEINDRIRLHRELTGCTPVVFVDYLQRMKKTDASTDMERIENNVRDLRAAARANNCPVFTILSYNRAGYYGSVDMTSGKGSGDIEYSTDVQLGMQPVGMQEGDNARAQNKELIHQTKRQLVRNIELVITKNRMGMTDKSVTFSYAAEFNSFDETGEGEAIIKRKGRSAANKELREREITARENLIALLDRAINSGLTITTAGEDPGEDYFG